MQIQGPGRLVSVARQACGHLRAYQITQHDPHHLGRYAPAFAGDHDAAVRHRKTGRTNGNQCFDQIYSMANRWK